MDEMKKDMGHGPACSCGACMMNKGMCYCGGRRFWALRWLLGLAILAIVFWMGVKVGEFKSYFQGGYGYYGQMSRHGMMMQGGNEMYRMPVMMQATTSATATPVK